MDTTTLIGVLAFGTMFAVLVFAYRSSVETTERLHAQSQKSTLAADAPNKTPPGVKPPDT